MTAAFRLKADPLQFTDDLNGGDVPGDTTSTVQLTPGTTMTGDIATAGDQDWYQITLTGGQFYSFMLNGTSASALSDPYLAIYDAAHSLPGQALATDNDSGPGAGAFTSFYAPTDGVYYVAASGFQGATGNYSLSAALAPQDTVGDKTTTSSTLTINGSVTSTISSSSDQDWYILTLQTGHSYIFTLTGTPSDGLPALENAGFSVVQDSGSWAYYFTDRQHNEGDAAQVVYTASGNATYYIAVNADGLATTQGGGYTITASEAPPDVAGDVTTNASVAVGGSIDGYLTTDLNSSFYDSDWFSITLQAGISYVFHLDSHQDNSMFDPDLSIRDGSNGGIWAQDYQDSGVGVNDIIHFTPTQTGTYYLDVTSQYGGDGGYTLSAAVQPSDLAANTDTTGTVVPGQPTRGYIDGSGDADWYKVQVTSGQTYVFTLGEANEHGEFSFQSTYLDLMNATGGLIAGDTGGGYANDSQIVYKATATGTVYLSASYPDNDTGEYLVAARLVTDAVGNTAATSQHLAMGGTINGQSDYVGDQDWFAVTLQAGQTYQFTIDTSHFWPSDGNPTSPSLGLVSSSGVVLQSADSGYQQTVLRFSPTQSGTYYLNAGLGSERDGVAGYGLTAAVADTISNNIATQAHIAAGESVNGSVDFAALGFIPADEDWYAISLTAGQGYVFTLAAAASGGLSVPTLNLYSGNGTEILSHEGVNGTSTIQFYAQTSGTYYLGATDVSNAIGNYVLSANATDDVFDSVNTHTTLAINTSIQSTIDTTGDQDWFHVDLVAGQSYLFNVDQSGATPLADCYLTLCDAAGNQIGYNDDGGVWPNSLLRYTATTTGTYYVVASGFENATGDYTIGAKAVAPQNPLNTIDWGTQITNTTVKVYFAAAGESFENETALRAWTADEQAAFLRACQTWSTVCNVTFTPVSSAADATMVVVLKDLGGSAAAFMDTPPGNPQVGVFDPYWGSASIGPGSLYFTTFIHEVGHFLGLAHPHDSGGTSEVMEGVYQPSDYGVAGLNQCVYTVMSYNDGFNGISSASFGDVATPMALDAAVVQQKYGATSHNTGNDTYSLTGVNGNYSLIWDTGGTDSIVNNLPNSTATIDLRPATLTNTPGGGGYVSHIDSVMSGFTIAHGVVIENATGNSGADTIHGNDADNVINGMAGDDVIWGGLGNDTLDGGDDTDLLTFASLSNGVSVDLAVTAAQNTGAGLDTISGFENLNGSAFSDILKGTDGANTINAFDGDNIVDGRGGNDNLTTGSGADTLYGGDGDDTLTAGAGNDVLYGGTGTNALYGGTGDDTYYTDSSTDQIIEWSNEGYDTVYASANVTIGSWIEAVFLTGNAHNATDNTGLAVEMTGNALDNVLQGGGGDNHLYGLDGNDMLLGGYGNNYMEGGFGSDTYDIGQVFSTHDEINDFHAGDSASSVDRILLAPWVTADMVLVTRDGAGDLVLYIAQVGVTITVDNYFDGADYQVQQVVLGDGTIWSGAALEVALPTENNDILAYGPADDTVHALGGADTVHGGDGNDKLYGDGGDDALYGESGNDLLDGGLNADNMYGGLGDDTFIVDNVGDVVHESANAGTDLVLSSVTFSLAGQNIENLTLTGTSNVNASGNSLANVLVGNGGNNVLNGQGGADDMTGGLGNDTYFVDNAGDVIHEDANGGTDAIVASFTYSLAGQNIENLTLTGTGNTNATGNALSNVLVGNDGNNTLNGDLGADNMSGGLGNDTYYVDNIGDVVHEGVNAGTDLVYSTVTFSLSGQNAENLTLTGTANINATGNSLVNVLTGNNGNNVLDGGLGADTMIGGIGHDTYYVDNVGDVVTEVAGGGSDTVVSSIQYYLGANLENLTLTGTANINGRGTDVNNVLLGNSGNNQLLGYDGNDRIDGGAGADDMWGGAGNDTYYVDNAGDVVHESLNSGTDLIISTFSYNLSGQNVENLTLMGSGDINATGNSLVNVLLGNSGNNVIDGKGGADDMWGYGGNDTYYVDNAGDVVHEGVNAGTDLVYSTVTFSLSGQNAENLTLTGSASINATGNSLANVLTGNTGSNVFTGGLGADTFAFLAHSGHDVINDFQAGQNDTIRLVDYTSAVVTQTGSDVVVDMGNGNFITVLQATTADVNAHLVFG